MRVYTNMKELTFIVKPNSNILLVQQAFDLYLEKPNAQNLINLAKITLAYAMSKTQIQSMELVIGKCGALGSYNKGRITLSKRLFKKAKKLESVVGVLEALFHELTHALQEANNLNILKTLLLIGIIAYTLGVITLHFINVKIFKKGVNVD